MTLYKSVAVTPWSARRWPHFSAVEIACQKGACPYCYGEVFLDEKALDLLERMRSTLAKPLLIESGHRCREHNADIGGARNSAHLALAFDLALGGQARATLFSAAKLVGFSHFGFMKFGLHIDTRPSAAAAHYWSYGPTSRELWAEAWKTVGLSNDDVHDIGGM